MSWSLYPCCSIGFLFTKELILECLKNVSTYEKGEEDFENSFTNLNDLLASNKISLDELCTLDLNNEKFEDVYCEIMDSDDTNETIQHMSSYDEYAAVYPYNIERDSFEWSQMEQVHYDIYTLNYRFGLFAKPYADLSELEEEIYRTFPIIPKNYNILKNIVEYKCVYSG